MIAEGDGAALTADGRKAAGSTEGPAEAGGLRVSWHKILKSAVVSQQVFIVQNTRINRSI